jgi:hypothetical protein
MRPGPKRDPGYGERLERLQGRVNAVGTSACDVVVLGSSRIHEGLRAKALDAPLSDALGRPVVVTNFGMAGAGPLSELVNWQRLREDGVRPDVVVIEVVPAFLSAADPMMDVGPERMPVNKLRRSDLPILEHYVSDARPDLRHDWRIERFNPLYAHRLTILSQFVPGLVPMAFRHVAHLPLPEDVPVAAPGLDGWTPDRRPQALAHAHAEYEKLLQRFHLGGRNCEALRELLASCRKDGVRTALLVMPEGPVYHSWYAPGAYDEVRKWLENVSREYGCSVIDAREWMPTEDDYKDSHHLTPAGAERFTERLGREKLVPLLRSGASTGTGYAANVKLSR